jgi:hypothetical protein
MEEENREGQKRENPEEENQEGQENNIF